MTTHLTTHTGVLAHWIPITSSDPNIHLTPSSRQANFQRCPGCSLNDSSIKKTGLILHSAHGATCFLHVSLYTTLAMHGCVSRLSKDKSTVTMKSTFHTIATQLEQFANRLSIQPSTLSSEISPIEDPINIPDIVYTRNNDGSNAALHFYTDGSLMNLGTPDIKLGIGWVQTMDNDFILSDYSANIQTQ